MVEAVGDGWRAEQKLDLATRHADLNLFDRFLLEPIALLAVDLVDTGAKPQAGNQGQ